jgi:hypothetical protein
MVSKLKKVSRIKQNITFRTSRQEGGHFAAQRRDSWVLGTATTTTALHNGLLLLVVLLFSIL